MIELDDVDGLSRVEQCRLSLRYCEIAIGIIAKEPLTPVTYHDVSGCYEWLQNVHTKIESDLAASADLAKA